jgi:predicted transposase YbfD/YdcC
MHVKVVWVTMLALANRNGQVLASIPGLADAARVSLDQCVDALERLKSPDKFSRTKAHEGRRIEEVEDGWQLLNHKKYRDIRDADERRAQVREAVRKHRIKKSSVIAGNHGRPQKAHTEAESEAEKDTKGFDRFWNRYPKRSGGNPRAAALKAYRARVNDGTTEPEIQAGLDRYVTWCVATNKVGTEYVKQAQYWLSPTFEGWKQDWTPPDEPMSSLGVFDENS